LRSSYYAAALHANTQKLWEALDVYSSFYGDPANWQRRRIGHVQQVVFLPWLPLPSE
jgi:hypothetical protein